MNRKLEKLKRNLDEKASILNKACEMVSEMKKQLDVAIGEHAIALRLFEEAMKIPNTDLNMS